MPSLSCLEACREGAGVGHVQAARKASGPMAFSRPSASTSSATTATSPGTPCAAASSPRASATSV
eukprot:4344800-Prymnesium_polylepis.1